MTRLRLFLAMTALLLLGNRTGSAGDLPPADRPIEAIVDAEIDSVLAAETVTPARAADDATMVRRLTLDLIGRIPTAEESRAYVASNDPEKRTKLVDRLVASPGFARQQAAEFDALLAPNGPSSLRDYLVIAFGENRPWDQIFRELILPDESEKAEPSRKLASDYLRQRVKDLDRLTYEVSSTFFGVNISCAQCHDHPLVKDWKQDHFYGMKAFLSRTYRSGDFLGERGYGTVTFKTTEGVERQARMMFLTGRQVETPSSSEPTKEEKKAERERSKNEKVPPPPPAFSARAKLVEVALAPGEREFFARSIVNRVWNRLFGRGLVMPLDQMHSANPPSHPDLLAWLARDTIDHGYDLRRLVRGLVLSQAYSRSSVWPSETPPRPALFAVANVRPLTPAQLATSLRVATADPATLPADLSADEFEKRLENLEKQGREQLPLFKKPGGDNQIGVSEGLLFSNNTRVSQAILTDGSDRLVGRLKQINARAEQIDLVVRNILSRPPDDEEVRLLGAYLDQRTDRPEEAARQIVWALLTCSEFRFNH